LGLLSVTGGRGNSVSYPTKIRKERAEQRSSSVDAVQARPRGWDIFVPDGYLLRGTLGVPKLRQMTERPANAGLEIRTVLFDLDRLRGIGER
jgi:hypothetical protein